ncbi:hypothetical protein CICLE_v10030445mg [Citrus x clementina]|uniref:Uncharacterized protein n=1 Tax=Citrus clementina TaxID=85681 RepID=V4SIP8_CITCL|nr:hypothetical protein CICLE_v10030445mg [Citrus x clementina]
MDLLVIFLLASLTVLYENDPMNLVLLWTSPELLLSLQYEYQSSFNFWQCILKRTCANVLFHHLFILIKIALPIVMHL